MVLLLSKRTQAGAVKAFLQAILMGPTLLFPLAMSAGQLHGRISHKMQIWGLFVHFECIQGHLEQELCILLA